MRRTRMVLALVAIASLIASISYADQCVVCHGDPFQVERNCLASGCHGTIDNGNHHTTGAAMAGVCTTTPCHSPNLVADYDDENPLPYPASSVTPTVQSCNNCHKGHANPLDENGDPYPHPVYDTQQLEHMDLQGYYVNCLFCHGDSVDLDPNNPYRIRYCETCHSVETIHETPGHTAPSGPLPHGGFWYDENEVWTEITENERCLSCHGDPAPDTMAWVSQDVGTYDTKFSELVEADCRVCHGENTATRHQALAADCVDPPAAPVINTSACGGMSPVVGARMAHVTLTGTDFGDNGQLSTCGDYKAQMRPGDPDPWVDLPVISWTDTVIECNLPPWTFMPNQSYNVRVITPTGQSNLRRFYVLPGPAVDRIEDNTGKDTHGPAGGWLTVYSEGSPGTFNNARDKWYEDSLGGTCPNFYGSIYVVTLSTGSDRLCAKAYANWNETGNEDSFKVRLWNLWEDSDGDYYQDGNEPSGAPLHVGPYSVQVCLIVYADSDDSGGYSGGDDTVYQVVKSQSEITYELTNEPYINQLNPKSVERNRRFRIFGMNFGPTQTSGEVHVGTLKQFNTDPIGKGKVQPASRIKLWSNTKIAVRLRVPPSWAGKARRVWVVKDDMVSNSRKLTILP